MDQHFAQPALLCIEQTHNRMGGRVLSLEHMRECADWAAAHGLSVHVDGARVFNAAAALGVEVKEIAQHTTTCVRGHNTVQNKAPGCSDFRSAGGDPENSKRMLRCC